MSEPGGSHFITDIIDADLESGKHTAVVTRFPPEPNGYLHIGHAKSIALNFGLAERYGGRCHLRFDDTNPTTEDMRFVESIKRDVRWLGFDWGEHLYFASNYFEQLYRHALHLIETGHAYVCSLSEEQVRAYRGTVTEPGRPSPYRDRSKAENLALFERMRAGELADGSSVLRAKIDMASPNMKMRDPPIYRIKHRAHYRTGKQWCIYPLYDFTHCLSDAIEGITHSICTLEFENNRELYDWVLDHCEVACHPQQIEFARLNLSYTMMSKRKLAELVRAGQVSGWDDPRMPTIAGMRRRGLTAEAIRAFATLVGVAKNNSLVDIGKLEFCIRDDLNATTPRAMAVLHPLEVIIDSLPEDHREMIEAPRYPRESNQAGSRTLLLGRRLYIERDDFSAEPPPGFHRLAPGRRVRLRHSYVVRCEQVERDPDGEVVRLRCSHEPPERDGHAPTGPRVKGTIHWVGAEDAIDAEVRLYDRLFCSERPGDLDELNPQSLERLHGCKLEPSLATARSGDRYQFERLGYFCADSDDATPDKPVFNRTVSLRDTWAKLQARSGEARSGARPKRQRKTHVDAPSESEAGRGSRATATLAPAAVARLERLQREHRLTDERARILARDPALVGLYEAACATGADHQLVAKWITNELLGAAGDRAIDGLPVDGREIGALLSMLEAGKISGTVAKQVLGDMVAGGGTVSELVARRGGGTLGDDAALAALVEQVVADNPEPVARYRNGKASLLGFFVGQVMRRSGGRADAQRVRALLLERIG